MAVAAGAAWTAFAGGAAAQPLAAAAEIRPLALPAAATDWRRALGAPDGDGAEARALWSLRRLHEALSRPGPGRVVEDLRATPTAEEAFVRRRADCVGFALLLVALARAQGAAARFAVAAELTGDEHAGTWRLRHGHLATTFAGRVFDAGGERRFDPARDGVLEDRTAFALFFSNRGAQRLLAGEAAEAVELLYRAVRFDPSVPYVWGNLGAALGRTGDLGGAVLAQEMAVRLDPDDAVARRNLEALRARLPGAGGGAAAAPHGFRLPGRSARRSAGDQPRR